MDERLTHYDVPDIVDRLYEVQAKWYMLGRILKINRGRLDGIRERFTDPEECLFNVIDEFVKQVEPRPTWRVISGALKHTLIREDWLARRIEHDYGHPGDQQNGIYNHYVLL